MEPVSCAPIRPLAPVTTDSAPSGTPASSASRARARAVNGVAEAGFSTTVQPAQKAAATFRVTMAAGKFQGVMAATGPTGSWKARIRSSSLLLSMVRPPSRSAMPENQVTKELA